MANPIRAIYHQGTLQLLTPVDLVEGQEIELEIISPREELETLLGDLLIPRVSQSNETLLDEEEIFRVLDESIHLVKLASEIIIEEREDRF